MILRRYEVRIRSLKNLEDIEQKELPFPRFFFRNRAADYARYFNCVRLIHGYSTTTHYVHDRRDDK
jgi:hypothetical protein